MKEKNKIYFVSDSHFGIDYDKYTSSYREKLMISWLDEIKNDACQLHLCGDIFDFWFEYKYLVPRGFFQIFSKLRELSESGIEIYYYLGNHDMWTFGYIEESIGAKVLKNGSFKEINGKIFYIAHGDGLGPYDRKYNFLKKIFSSKLMQFMFKLIHPSISFRIATKWSSASRKKHKYPKKIEYKNEWLVKYAKNVLENQKVDYFIFGHRHIPFQYSLNKNSLFTNLGDWLFNFSYAVYDGENLLLKNYKPK
ncbi:MAG: UDP-2,3-diacylglucosamine diphosphatase [Bacteroidales bacterium]|nr:UDP-2,3-diacylglucosamine diphosphatase [Bacteroidales bacterium]MCK9498072.1 UDP-2,3-diacylglucosamine diphosphatase [Bacteroidales bacterium]MDY0313562.1 UDP-2,3-diacylglucosamine diphosphatase [Bacteroidales bacterium]NLB86944.1 UDP-2,3-diacylglucosamine diphosphatase [Bacteroidales bacterium]NLB87043.1 UDP-2,3-diacylglucosamine diphosphatase [Bacteroidales bacterium]